MSVCVCACVLACCLLVLEDPSRQSSNHLIMQLMSTESSESGRRRTRRRGLWGTLKERELVVRVPVSPLSGSVTANRGDPLRAVPIDAREGSG